MNTPTTFSVSPTDYLRHCTLSWLLFLFLSATGMAADLTFTPAMPIVEINRTLTLTVSGTVGTVEWITGKGTIQGDGIQVTYVAPAQAGLDVVTVLDSAGNTGLVKIVITLSNNVSLENAQWEIFTNRSQIQALLLSDDGKTLWVGTKGGLEKRDAQTGEIQQVLTRLDGLPNNKITNLLPDSQAGLWIGTEEGLAYLNSQGQLAVENKKDSKWPGDYWVTVILSDEQGGLWVGTKGGLAHRNNQGQWMGYNTESPARLPAKEITALLKDGLGGLWIGSYSLACISNNGEIIEIIEKDDSECDKMINGIIEEGGLAHLTNQGEWIIYTTQDSELPGKHIDTLLRDGQGGFWINTEGGLAYLSSQGKWTIYPEGNSEYAQILLRNKQGKPWVDDSGLIHLGSQNDSTTLIRENLGLLSTDFDSLINDGQGGLWLGLTHLDRQGKPIIYHQEGLSGSNILTTDKVGGLWLKTIDGLVHLNYQGERRVYNLKLPDNYITILLSDEQGGLWIDTQEGGLAHLSGQGELAVYSELPNDEAKVFLNDGQGGLWISTRTTGSLIHLSSQGQSTVYNSELPFNEIDALGNDGQGGIWIGNYRANSIDPEGRAGTIGLAHLSSQGQWTTYEKSWGVQREDSSHGLQTLLKDGQGGVWIIMFTIHLDHDSFDTNTLIHLNAQSQWTVYNELDSVFQIVHDEKSDLWIGMTLDAMGSGVFSYVGKGLAHLNGQDQLKVYTREDSELPGNYISELIGDGQGGLWIVTKEDHYIGVNYSTGGMGKGLAHLSGQGEWMVYTKESTVLPSDNITSILNDGQGGLWIGASDVGELAHLTFGRQAELCTQAQIDSATCQAIQQGQYAAIIVAAGGAQDTNTLWESTEAITTRIYRTFYRRGFAKSNLYYLSPKTWADFDGDGFNDRINRLSQDRNLTLDDLQKAFTWAKGLGKLDQPMYFFFMDHGGEGKLQLSPGVDLPAEELKTLLDDYQTATGNTMVVVIEACHSGSLIPILSAPNRAVIASAKDSEKAYFFEKKGFSRFLADYLLKGASFSEAFTLAGRDQEKLLGKNLNLQTAGEAGLTPQTPQLDDNQDGLFTTTDGDWLKTVYINGKFTTADATLAVENQTPATTLTVGQPITLQAKATVTQGTVKRVWAVIRPPAIAQVIDISNTPILAFPRLNLGTSPETTDVWQATWNEAVYNGNYLITFYAEDNEKNIASSEQDTVLTVTGGIDPPSTAQVQIHLEKDRYQRGEVFKATLTEELGWGYDLYAAVLFPAVLFPDEQNFMTLKNTNELRPLNEAKPWYAPRKPHSPLTLFELTLPADLPTGKYCLFGILSPEQNDVFETLAKGLWVMDSQCFEIF